MYYFSHDCKSVCLWFLFTTQWKLFEKSQDINRCETLWHKFPVYLWHLQRNEPSVWTQKAWVPGPGCSQLSWRPTSGSLQNKHTSTNKTVKSHLPSWIIFLKFTGKSWHEQGLTFNLARGMKSIIGNIYIPISVWPRCQKQGRPLLCWLIAVSSSL